METTNKTKMERLIAMCEDYKIDIEIFYSITIDGSQIKLQTKYNADLIIRMKDRISWELNTEYAFVIGHFEYNGVSFRVTLT